MSNIFFSSDHHFGHANIIRYCDRPYDSVEAMNEDLIERWNRVVGLTDLVYSLGDFSMTLGAVERITPRLNGHKHIIAGNHDHIHPYHPKSRKPEVLAANTKIYKDAGWTILPLAAYLTVLGLPHPITMTHFPYASAPDPSYTDKYVKYRPQNYGQWLLCGHRHLRSQEHLDRMIIDVGVDANNYTPISLDYVLELIRSPR